MNPFLSLIVPAYNEANRLGATLKTALAYLESQSYTFELIVVDDGSSDTTIQVAKSISEKIIVLAQPQNMGKGAAVRRGMLEAKGEIRLFSDADFSTPIYETEKIISGINAGADVCIGSRALDYSLIKVHQPVYREFMGKVFNKFVQALVFKGISDTQCGFKAFKAESAKHVFSKVKIDGFGFDVEALYLAVKAGYKIKEAPVEWYNDERTKVSPIKDSARMFLDLIKIKRLHS